jgi:hypothetical protein
MHTQSANDALHKKPAPRAKGEPRRSAPAFGAVVKPQTMPELAFPTNCCIQNQHQGLFNDELQAVSD